MSTPIQPAQEPSVLAPPQSQTEGDRVARELDRSLMSGVAWTAGVKWLSQLLTWPATLIVAHLLTPDDYGLLAMATVYLGLVNLVNEFGLGSAIVRHKELTSRQISQINGLCVLFGFGGFLATMAAAKPLAIFYRTPELTAVVFALSINFLINSFKTVPYALMQRDLQFRLSAVIEAISAIVQSTTLVAFAWFGFRYWTMVIASLLTSVFSTALICYRRPHSLAWPRPSEIGGAIRYGSHFVGSRIGWYLYSNADFFIIGRVLGETALGNYSFGLTLATLPVEKVTSLVGRVAPPIFSAVQDDYVALRRYLAILTAGVAVITFPAGLGLALVAHDVVLLALGDKWREAIAPLQILAVYACFRSIIPIVSQMGNTVGLSRFVMRNSVASAIVLPLAFLVGTRWGTSGVAYAWIAAYPLVAVPLCFVVFRKIGMSFREYLRALWPALSSGVLMVPAVMLVQRGVNPGWPISVRLAIQVTTGAVVYLGAIWALHRREVRGALELFRAAPKRA